MCFGREDLVEWSAKGVASCHAFGKAQVLHQASCAMGIVLSTHWVVSLEQDRLGVRLDPTFLRDIELIAWE